MWIDRAVRWLLPREEHFFDMLEHGAACARKSGELLVAYCDRATSDSRESLLDRMRDVEHEADRVIIEIYDALNRTFVTPIDRSDIYTLGTALEGITDHITLTGSQIILHAMDDLPDGSCELAGLISQACEAIHGAVVLLRDLKDRDGIRDRCEFLKRLESEGDQIYRTRVAELFKTETNAIRLLKHKEFLESLEQTLDACDDVGNALDTIVIKNA